MSKRAKGHLKKYKNKNTEHVMQALLTAYITDPDDLDLKISLAGCMQQTGWRINQTSPYFNDFEIDEEQWIRRCIERILQTFRGDPFATSALIYVPPEKLIKIAKETFTQIVYADCFERDKRFYRVILAKSFSDGSKTASGPFASYCLDILWSPNESNPREVHYSKVISGKVVGEYLHGENWFRYQASAHNPEDYWFSTNADQTLNDIKDVKRAVLKLPKWVKE